jgi:hypothetical protein
LLSGLLLFELEEAPGAPVDDVVEVSNDFRALEPGMTRLREGFPLYDRLPREMHARPVSGGRGSDKEPGEFHRTRPGNTRFVPTPPHEIDSWRVLSYARSYMACPIVSYHTRMSCNAALRLLKTPAPKID